MTTKWSDVQVVSLDGGGAFGWDRVHGGENVQESKPEHVSMPSWAEIWSETGMASTTRMGADCIDSAWKSWPETGAEDRENCQS